MPRAGFAVSAIPGIESLLREKVRGHVSRVFLADLKIGHSGFRRVALGVPEPVHHVLGRIGQDSSNIRLPVNVFE